MVQFGRLVPVLLLAAAGWLGAIAETRADALDRPAVEAIVRDYLLNHPEIIEEAVTILRKRRADEAAAEQSKIVAENRALIFDSKHQMVIGNPDGPITLVEFFDYNCGYCKRAQPDLDALIDANTDLRVVLKEFPILTEGSEQAARVSVAVKDAAPEKYEEFHEELLLAPGEANTDKALAIAGGLGLDEAALKTAAGSNDVTANLSEVRTLAEALGINGTPSYVIGDSVVPGAAGFEALQGLIGSVRECGATTC